jgi:Protein of unknown function with PCYCGC motif
MLKSRKKGGAPAWIYGLAGLLLFAIGYRLMNPPAAYGSHPEPRAGITSSKVRPASEFAAQPDVARAYAVAKEVPEVLDGLYCHCDCSKHAHHRSLLTCFESEHGSMCDICMGEALLAYKLAQEGKTLEQIRVAIDAQFG